jgi:hypothetical protein
MRTDGHFVSQTPSARELHQGLNDKPIDIVGIDPLSLLVHQRLPSGLRVYQGRAVQRILRR